MAGSLLSRHLNLARIEHCSRSGPFPSSLIKSNLNTLSYLRIKHTPPHQSHLTLITDHDGTMNSQTEEETRPILESSESSISFLYGATLGDDQDDEEEEDISSMFFGLRHNGTQQEEDSDDDNDDNDDEEDTITSLTRRLRCMFGIITWPIVPLGTLVALALVWMLYASLQDMDKSCSHPLHAYATASVILCCYAPLHTHLRSRLFSYNREVDGPQRPVHVRQFDQCFHTLTLVYVYMGIMLVQTCRSDNDNDVSTCAATCPNLFPALRLYVTTIELFTLSLVLPLLCLPCIYLWFLQRATADAEALSILQDRLRDEEALRRNGNAHEILQQLQDVKLMVDPRTIDGRIVLMLPHDSNDLSMAKDANDIKECCICMETFAIQNDIETGQLNDDEAIVQTTTCGHVFHKRCIASWVGGRWESNDESSNSRRARRTTCPLCRNDLRPDS